MKKKSINTIINVTIMTAGIVMSALSNNKNCHRRMEAMKKASADVSRQIGNEKLLNKKGAEIMARQKEALLMGDYAAGSTYSCTYGSFFLLQNACHSIYNDDRQVTVGKYHTDDDKHFRAYELFIADGRLFTFIADNEDVELYDGGSERHMSFDRICQAHKNIEGTLYVADHQKDAKVHDYIWQYGEEQISNWRMKSNKPEPEDK